MTWTLPRIRATLDQMACNVLTAHDHAALKGIIMYCDINFKTKKALKEAVTSGKKVYVFSPGPFPAPTNGRCAVEGPHYPEPHKWYAQVEIVDGQIVSVK